MGQGNLSMYLKAHVEVDRIAMLDRVATGLAYLLTQGIIHNSLRAATLLVDDDGEPCLAPYTASSILLGALTRSKADHDLEKVAWLAPELIAPDQLEPSSWTDGTTASDVYAFGMTILEVLTHALPFSGMAPYTILSEVPNGLRPPHPVEVAVENDMTPAIWAYIERCWGPPDSRPTAAEWKDAAHPATTLD